MKRIWIGIVVMLGFAASAVTAGAQNRLPGVTFAKPGGGGPLQTINPPVVRSAPLRAAPLPADTLSRSGPPAVGSVYSVPYGPNFSRPAGSAVVPFGSSRYYVAPRIGR